MTVLGSLCTTFLALFLLQVHLCSAEDSIPHITWNVTRPRSYFWSSQFDLQKDKAGVIVHINDSSLAPYTICANETNPRGFLIKYVNKKIVLDGQEEEDARCGHAHTYHDSPHVNYTVDAKRGKTDKWWMSVLAKDGTTDDFIYHRSQHGTTGDVRHNQNGTLAARIRFSKWLTPHKPEQLTTLVIEPHVSVETKYFIGLWTTVKLRWDRCHK